MSPGLALQLAVGTPMLVAALLAAAGRVLPRLAMDALALAAVLASAGLLAWVLPRSTHTVVVWMGGWRPRDGEGVGIPLAADAFGVGLALLVMVLAVAALIFSWRYFAEVQAIFHALMLLFVAAMCAFILTGDLFDAFVFFELMSVAACVLTGYKSEEPQTVHGAFNFGVVNSLGAYLTLTGITLLYACTGELGFAAIGAHLAAVPHLVVIAGFTLVATGFLVKAAAVPFHFWLADAHAVAPTPVCVLFSGVMVELGVYAVARLYWTTFAGSLAAPALGRLLGVLGAGAALLGAVMCLQQSHIKRLLAYSTISHVGLMLVGVAVLRRDALAGVAIYLIGHAGVKGALFLGAGALLNRHETVDESELHGRGRAMPVAGLVFLLGGLGLAGLPLFGTWAGKALIEHTAEARGWWWVTPLGVLASAFTGGAVLRVWLHVFRGAGTPAAHTDPESGLGSRGDSENAETRGRLRALPWTMTSPPVVLLLGVLFLALVPGLGQAVSDAAASFSHADAGAAPVLWTGAGVSLGLLTGAAAGAVAALGVWGRAAPNAVRSVMSGLRSAHSGHVGDYVAWLAAGVALMALLLGG